MVIVNKKETKQVEIGIIKNSTFQAFDNGPKVEAKFFPYEKAYSKNRFIKEVTIFTDSRMEKATIKLHFYKVNEDGSPGEELLIKDYIVTLNKGVIKHKFNLSNLDLEFPKNGLFVAYEKLLIEKNMLGTKYQPYVLYNYVLRDFFYTYAYGTWSKQVPDFPDKLGINEPAITLVLSN